MSGSLKFRNPDQVEKVPPCHGLGTAVCNLEDDGVSALAPLLALSLVDKRITQEDFSSCWRLTNLQAFHLQVLMEFAQILGCLSSLSYVISVWHFWFHSHIMTKVPSLEDAPHIFKCRHCNTPPCFKSLSIIFVLQVTWWFWVCLRFYRIRYVCKHLIKIGC